MPFTPEPPIEPSRIVALVLALALPLIVVLALAAVVLLLLRALEARGDRARAADVQGAPERRVLGVGLHVRGAGDGRLAAAERRRELIPRVVVDREGARSAVALADLHRGRVLHVG